MPDLPETDEEKLVALHVHRSILGGWYITANVRRSDGTIVHRTVFTTQTERPIFYPSTGELIWVDAKS